MKEQIMHKNEARPLAIGLIILGGLIRVTQHWNFAPVGAISLFAGARLRGWRAYALPLALMAVTDPLLGGYSALTPLIYASFLLNVWIGSRLRETESPLAIGGAALAGSVQFFLLTNFAWLYPTSLYPHNFAGILASYTAGVPFFWRTLASDLFYSGVLFGLHAWLSRTVARRERVTAAQAA
ncbi:MAG TPA: DUF6580 family putative transport protein [Candidatus Acidoferrales bacterium]|nr:DUF6580 family putative transport protein [Candidatus Acidoferrales bacterium]